MHGRRGWNADHRANLHCESGRICKRQRKTDNKQKCQIEEILCEKTLMLHQVGTMCLGLREPLS